MATKPLKEPEASKVKTRHAVGLALAASALIAVFLAYLRPEFALTAVNWIASCF